YPLDPGCKLDHVPLSACRKSFQPEMQTLRSLGPLAQSLRLLGPESFGPLVCGRRYTKTSVAKGPSQGGLSVCMVLSRFTFSHSRWVSPGSVLSGFRRPRGAVPRLH